MSVYSATKGAVFGAVAEPRRRICALRHPRDCVVPGYVKTVLIGRYMQKPMIAKALLTETPLRRFGTPQDIANAALFLASDAAAYITGARPPCRWRHEHYALV